MGIAVIENNNRFNIVCNNIKDKYQKVKYVIVRMEKDFIK